MQEIREMIGETMTSEQNEGIKEQTKPLSISWDDHKELKIVKDALMKRYELLDYLGGGGFGKVFKLKDKKLGRECALKVLNIDKLDESSEDERKKNKIRFIREAKAYAKCSNPNIAPIFDIGDEDTFPYFIMEYVKGSCLEDVIAEKSYLSFTKVLKISEGVLSALECIHKQDLIHRDIKPANIMIDKESEQIKIIDFGIAKDLTSSLTSSQIRFGSPYYMAPEQFRDSSKVTLKTDIYSFGVVLYEMLAGEVPFKGKSQIEIMYGHLEKPVPNIRKRNPELPEGIEKIIFKAMAKEPEDRYKNAGEFRDAIRQIDETIKRIEKDKEVVEAKPVVSIKKPTPKEEEDGKKPIKPVAKRGPLRKYKYKYLVYISVIIVAVIAVLFFLKSFIPIWQYNGFISSAKNFIESKDWEKAGKALKKAKELKDTPEIERLLAGIMEQRLVEMKADFDDIKDFLKGKSSKKDKLEKCREFLAKYEGISGNGEKTVIFSEVNLSISNLDAEVKLDESYQNLLSDAGEYIKKGDYPKAIETLEKARKNRGTDTDEIAALSKEIEEKQIAAMRNDFETLKKFLAGRATEKEKIEKCRAFLGNHPNTTRNKDIQAIRDEIGRVISSLNADIISSEQYKMYIDAVNNLIKSKDYEKAEKEINNARKIKDSEEVKRLSTIITQGIKKERIDGEKKYNSIKAKLTLSQYQTFQRNYPHSVHLRDLKKRLRKADKNLLPEKYWDKPVMKNEKGYYEITFGEDNNRHHMIYIPEKGFWIDKYEVSWTKYNEFSTSSSIDYEYPVIVTYEKAEDYCTKYGLRLPKEDEWEYVAGKGKFTYPWGNESPDKYGIYRANFLGDSDGFDRTAPINSFDKYSSPFGAVNMAGNVWEWVKNKILKGGGSGSAKEYLKIINSRQLENWHWIQEGFRCIKDENK